MAITEAIRQAAYRARERKAIAAAERFPSKRIAYQTGYKVGYTRAWKAWKSRHDRLLRVQRRVGAA